MPNDILSIKRKAKSPIKNPTWLSEKIEAYFQQQHPTIAGLALFLGFSSLEDFIDYEQHGRRRKAIKRASLRIEAIYEQKLHTTSATGAMFALKNMGWKDRSTTENEEERITKFTMAIAHSPVLPASSEKDVVL